TPGLVESSGKVALEEMILPPPLPPLPRLSQRSPARDFRKSPQYSPALSPTISRREGEGARSHQTLDSERHTLESALSDTSSRQSHSTDDEKNTITMHHHYHHHH
ncbi:hypothetical protein FHG87_015688, partial [Trinorchestia longiramus]